MLPTKVAEKPTNVTEARKKAKALGIIPGKTRKAELAHSIQIEEGCMPCFGKFERPMCTYSLLLHTELPQNRVIR
jgi:hypothetical protein